MIQCDAIEIPAHILRVGDFSAAELLERRNRGVLQNVRGHLGIAYPPQDQRAQAGIIAIDCGEVGHRIRYRSRDVRLRGKHPDGCCVVTKTNHELSISLDRQPPQASMRAPAVIRRVVVAIVLAAWAVPGATASLSCGTALGA